MVKVALTHPFQKKKIIYSHIYLSAKAVNLNARGNAAMGVAH